MTLRRLFGGGRLLRSLVKQLTRIADALETQNAISFELHPALIDQLTRREAGEAPGSDSGVSYVDPDEILMAETIREEEALLGLPRRSDDQLLVEVLARLESERRRH